MLLLAKHTGYFCLLFAWDSAHGLSERHAVEGEGRGGRSAEQPKRSKLLSRGTPTIESL